MTRRPTLASLLALALLAGCAPRTAPATGPEPVYHRLGPLELSAMLEQDGVDVMGSVDVMNTSGRTVLLEYEGGCEFAVLVGAGEGRAHWDEALWWSTRPEICSTSSTRLEIPARTLARILTPVVTTLQIAGDSIPMGAYPAAVRLRMLQPRDTTLVLTTGPVRLER